MRYYHIECEVCYEESTVVLDNNTEDDPYYCPMCGTESRSSMVDELDDSDN